MRSLIHNYLVVLGVLAVHLPLLPCTVFYMSQGDVCLGGNSEDYTDPNTGMFFIPPVNGKYGWVKFGFMGGYPQGGMNDQGMFWDATGCVSMAMPESEAAKEWYDGSLMQKVMEECTNVQEALQIFDRYYCDDQYSAQYLIGDANGCSVIVEGDSRIVKSEPYQVATNFYQSHPELGGYPCWRFDAAVSILSQSDTPTIPLFANVLAATHQDGRYPTQYSNVYDLNRGLVYLFYYHHYEEYVVIDLGNELAKGPRTYAIPPIFSEMTPIAPADEAQIDPSLVTFSWRGNPHSTYALYLSEDPDFSDCDPIHIPTAHSSSDRMAALFLLMPLGVVATAGMRRHRRKIVLGLIVVALFPFMTTCSDDGLSSSEGALETMEMTLSNLNPNTIFYWKVEADPQGSIPFKSTSVIRSFSTFD